ncbi:MAG: glycosyltransferase [Gammaproteobacteria bacterium]|nr:glycosyltransferase [Gammaproteobacteria bacterium]
MFETNIKPGFSAKKLDEKLPLYEIKLFSSAPIFIYQHELKTRELQQIKRGLKSLIEWTENDAKILSLVNHPFWTEIALSLPNSELIYDCMDHHAGFGNIDDFMIALEKKLLLKSTIVLTSSQKLFEEGSSVNSSVVLIRNATEFDHFKNQPADIFLDSDKRKIIGYYGAIADWFDVSLVGYIAQRFPDALILLVGDDTIGAKSKLSQYTNIQFTGEVSYQKLPYYLHAFDVCLIPFLINPLTEATNPVKVYEYLSAGKPVVSVNLPELRELSEHVSIGNTPNDFIEHIKNYFHNPGDTKSRQFFASQQTWESRIGIFEKTLHTLKRPFVSVIILTHNNLTLTQKCIESIERYTQYPAIEIIIVDNASTDGTRDYLQALSTPYKIILNNENKGFSAGNNIGILAARGDYLVLLNNDTTVTPGWLLTLLNHCTRNPEIGLLGPMTDNIGNEAKIDLTSIIPSQKEHTIKQEMLAHMGELMPLKTLAFFCVMIPHKIIREVGLLDEQFGLGFFEDDDYCKRVRVSGYQIQCARDVFVHHHLSASFDKMTTKAREALFQKNKILFEKKWGAWEGHSHKKNEDSLQT